MASKYFHFSVTNFLLHFSGTTGAAEGFYDISREPYWGHSSPTPQKTELITSPKNAFTATSHNDFVLKCIFPGDIGRYIPVKHMSTLIKIGTENDIVSPSSVAC